MRKERLYILLFAFVLIACKGKSDIAANPLSRKQMEAVMWDLMRADLFVSNNMVIKDTALDKKKQQIQFYTQILHIHHISQEDFRKSFRYYRDRPELMKDLMDTLNHRIDTLPVAPKKLMPVKSLRDSAI